MPDTSPAARFAACLAEVLAHEGGYADHPADPGGATNMGITRRTLADWRKISPWTDLSKAEVQALKPAEAAAIYKAMYWDRCAGEQLPVGVDLAVFDFAVNSGPDRAIRALQEEVKVTADGFAGPVTLGAVRDRIAKSGAQGLIAALCDRRLSFLQQLATYATFGRGWSSRVAAVRRAALALAGVAAKPQSTGIQPRRPTMDFLSGYRTYIIALVMLLAGAAQLLGVELPALDGQSAGHLMMEAFAVIFLRRGITTKA